MHYIYIYIYIYIWWKEGNVFLNDFSNYMSFSVNKKESKRIKSIINIIWWRNWRLLKQKYGYGRGWEEMRNENRGEHQRCKCSNLSKYPPRKLSTLKWTKRHKEIPLYTCSLLLKSASLDWSSFSLFFKS